MNISLRKINKPRVYSESSTRRLVLDFEPSKFSIVELIRLHNVSEKRIYR
ncbi:hypothetical protein ATE84_2403 [Aquimarina sp. MAR_2010_214]|nr:hypothetical protein ATE84_2403 [Aquimarina sp. MAR_2010_214]